MAPAPYHQSARSVATTIPHAHAATRNHEGSDQGGGTTPREDFQHRNLVKSRLTTRARAANSSDKLEQVPLPERFGASASFDRLRKHDPEALAVPAARAFLWNEHGGAE